MVNKHLSLCISIPLLVCAGIAVFSSKAITLSILAVIFAAILFLALCVAEQVTTTKEQAKSKPTSD